MDIASLVSDPGTIVAWIVSVGIPAAAAAYLGYQNGGLKGAFNAVVNLGCSNVPQTADQTALITSGKVPDAFWKMPDATKDRLFQDLRNHGAEIKKADLLAVIAKAEAASQVEYAIILTDHNGEIDRTIINPLSKTQLDPDQQHEVYHAFVSYGNYSTQIYTETHAKALETSSVEYQLGTFWYMTDAERKQLYSEIGDHPACIGIAGNAIKAAEDKQDEQYYITCGSPSMSWEITKGNITNRWGGTTEPAAPAAEVETPTT